MSHSPPTALDVFAGAGGLSAGFADAGFVVHGVESNAWAAATHVENVGPCDLADATTWHPTRTYDVVCGGPPCQPFAQLGRKGRFNDARGLLYRELIRAAVEATARCVMIESVKGLATLRDPKTGERGPTRVLRELTDAGFAHGVAAVLDAADYGVPQHRDRLFLVAFRHAADAARWTWPVPTHAGPAGETGAVGVALDLVPYREARPDAKSHATLRDVLRSRGRLPASAHRRDVGFDAPAPTVTATESRGAPRFGSRGGTTAPRHMVDRVAVAEGEAAARLVKDPEVLAAVQGFPAGWRWVGPAEEVYRMVGNAVPPPLAAVVARAIRLALRR